MNAYYYGFTPTGNEDIDAILSAVAAAGKDAHHTESWNDIYEWEEDGLSAVDRIQNAANKAAGVTTTTLK
jgi:hypothetical protein